VEGKKGGTRTGKGGMRKGKEGRGEERRSDKVDDHPLRILRLSLSTVGDKCAKDNLGDFFKVTQISVHKNPYNVFFAIK